MKDQTATPQLNDPSQIVAFSEWMKEFIGWSEETRKAAFADFMEAFKKEPDALQGHITRWFKCTEDHIQAFLDKKKPQDYKTELADKIEAEAAKAAAEVKEAEVEKANATAWAKAKQQEKLALMRANAPAFFQSLCFEQFKTPKDIDDAIGGGEFRIRDIFNGKTKNPRVATLKKICSAFGKKLNHLEKFDPENDAIIITKPILSAFLKAYKTVNGLNETQMAEKSGYERSAYSRFINNPISIPHMSALENICKGLGVEPREISDFGKRLKAQKPKPAEVAKATAKATARATAAAAAEAKATANENKLHNVCSALGKTLDDLDNFDPDNDAVIITKSILIAFLNAYQKSNGLEKDKMATICRYTKPAYTRFINTPDGNIIHMPKLEGICKELGVKPHQISNFGKLLKAQQAQSAKANDSRPS